MKEEGGNTAASPPAAASSSPTASQENDQAQANAAAAPSGVIASSKTQNEERSRQYAAGCGRRKGGGGVRGTLFKGRSKHKPAQGVGSGAAGAAACGKFTSPEAVLSAARQVKDSLPQLSPELLANLKARGLEPCTLKEVLEERGIGWAATQVRGHAHSYPTHSSLVPFPLSLCIGGLLDGGFITVLVIVMKPPSNC